MDVVSTIMPIQISSLTHLMGKKQRQGDGNSEDVRKSNLIWNVEMDTYFIDCLLEEQTKGNRVDGTWSKTALNNTVVELKGKLQVGFSTDLNKDHLKNRMKTMKSNFHTIYELFKNLSGFSWNPTTELFEAEPEVWNELLQSNPKAFKWRHTKIPNYEKLYDLFAKDRATGEGSMTAREQIRRWAMEGSSNQFSINSDNEEEDVNVEQVTPHNVTTQINTESTSSSKRSNKRKAKYVDLDPTQLEAINTAITKVANALENANTFAVKSTVRIYSEEEVYNELKEIGAASSWRIQAFLFLTNNPGKARQFFGVPREDRLDLLVMMMQSASGPM